MKSSKEAFSKACKNIGGQRAMAEALGIGESFVSQIISGGKSLPIKHALTIENLTGVSRKKLFPDTYQFYWSDI